MSTLKTPHTLFNPDEAKRIIALDGIIMNNRVNGVLTVTRAMGDTGIRDSTHNNSLISNIPDIFVNDIPQQGTSFLITACDGLTENDLINEQSIAAIVKKHMASSPAEIAKQLALNAHVAGSNDNIGADNN